MKKASDVQVHPSMVVSCKGGKKNYFNIFFTEKNNYYSNTHGQ